MQAPMSLIWIADILGSFTLIVLSLYAVVLMKSLYRKKKYITLYSYLLIQTTALAIFAVSRSGGHIIKHILVTSGNAAAWKALAPVSGSVNSITFVIFGLITLLYANVKSTAERVDNLERRKRELKESEVRLKEALNVAESERAKTHAMIAGIGDGISIQSREYKVLFQNEIHKKLAGDHIGEYCYEAYEKNDSVCEGCPVEKAFDDGKIHTAERKIAMGDGIKYFEITASPIRDADGEIMQVIEDVRDITERKKMEEQLKHHALYDALTNLPNRFLFFDRLRNLFAQKTRQKDLIFALLFLDLDHFKKINDGSGHSVGDELLVQVSHRLMKCVRPGDTVSRFGGDEFVIILNDIDDERDAIVISERILDALSIPILIEGHEVGTSASIGIAMSELEDDHPESLLRNADIAMYQAKASGRNRSVLFDKVMHADFIESLNMEKELQRALDEDEFVLYYQPVVSLDTGDVIGCEALIRWENPERGLIMPGRFISIAEETGMINEIGDWVILEACKQLSIWKTSFKHIPQLYVSVNISPKQFESSFPGKIKAALRKFNLDPHAIRLEITESIIMDNPEKASGILSHLNAMDVQVFLDDFGTGYSSLNYLHKFPVNAIKIDPSFVRNIRHDKDAREIVKAIAGLANNLGIYIIVEGVEDLADLELFRKMQCKYVQGYLFSEPLEKSRLEAYMNRFSV